MLGDLSSDGDWRTTVESSPLGLVAQTDLPRMVQTLNERLQVMRWDIAVFVTDLPYRDNARPVVAMLSPSERIALLSLPSLGLFRIPRRVRDTVLGAFGELLLAEPGRSSLPGRVQYAGQRRNFVLSGARGRLRLLAGMVRANRPWLLFTGLSRALVGVFATAAFGLVSSDVWQVSLHLGTARDAAFTFASITAVVAWLIIDHELWERPSGEIARQQATLFNLATVVTLYLDIACLFAALFLLVTLTAAFLLTPETLPPVIGHHPDAGYYLSLGWFIASRDSGRRAGRRTGGRPGGQPGRLRGASAAGAASGHRLARHRLTLCRAGRADEVALLRLVLVDESNRYGSLARGGGHSLDGPAPDVACCEDARKRGFQHQRSASERRPEIHVGRRLGIGSGKDESSRIQSDHILEPLCVRSGSDEDEEGACFQLAAAAADVVLDDQRTQNAFPQGLAYLGVGQHFHLRVAYHLIHQVARHVLGEVAASDNQVHLWHKACEEEGPLPSGVAPADHGDRVHTAQIRFVEGGGVVDAGAFQTVDARDLEPAVPHSRGQDDRAGLGLRTVREGDGVVAVASFEGSGLGGHADPCAKFVCLEDRAFDEFIARYPGREAQIVLDARRGACLASGGHRVDSDRDQAVGRTVRRRRARPGPHRSPGDRIR